MILPHDERTFVLNLHDQGKSPDYIAAALTQRRALEEVQGILHDHAGHIQYSEYVRAMEHHVFLPPKVAGSITIQAMKVFTRDLSAFCKAHGLSEKEMLRVAAGEIDAHRGWRQGPLSAMYCKMTPRALILHRADVQEIAQGLKAANPGPTTHKSNQANSPTVLPATTFEP
jgi:hypothetical protein